MSRASEQWDSWFQRTKPVLPVMVIDELDFAVPLAKALVEGGIHLHEVTLRTECALEAIERIGTECPEAIVGAGSVMNGEDMRKAVAKGANFVLSPGISADLCETALALKVPFIPGVMSASDVMLGLEYGFSLFKFFPAEAAGGIPMLASLNGPFPNVRFCPTGGINESNFENYLSLDYVPVVGGSWMCSAKLVREQAWESITERCLSIK